MTKKDHQNQKHDAPIQLSATEFKELGHQLTDIMTRLDMTNLAIEGMQFTQKQDQGVFNWLATRFFETSFEQNQKIYHLLDKVAFYLLECDNAKELEAYAKSKQEG